MAKRSINWWHFPLAHFVSPSTARIEDYPSTLKARLAELWKSFLLNLKSSTEPRVWHERDREGNTLWNAYDPVTGKSVYGITEHEMRIWIEHR